MAKERNKADAHREKAHVDNIARNMGIDVIDGETTFMIKKY